MDDVLIKLVWNWVQSSSNGICSNVMRCSSCLPCPLETQRQDIWAGNWDNLSAVQCHRSDSGDFIFKFKCSLNAADLALLSVSSTIQSGPITFSLSLSLIFPSICDSNSIPWHFPALFQHKWKQWNILIVSPPSLCSFFMVDRMAVKNIKFSVTGWCNNGLGYLNTLGAHPHLTNEQVEPFLKHGEKMSSSH